MRSIIEGYFNKDNFLSAQDESIDFKEKLKESPIGKTFTDFVYWYLNGNGSNEVTRYDFHLQAYTMLDMLDISKEPAKYIKFGNMFNDGLHSYSGAFSDLVVSDDKGFIKKNKTTLQTSEYKYPGFTYR